MNFDRFTKDYSNEPVPKGEQRGLISLLAVFVAFAINLASIVFGMQIGLENDFQTIFWGSVLGGVLLAVIGSSMAYIGAKTKLSAAMVSKFAFGKIGANLVALIFAASLFGWFGVQTEIFADSLGALLNQLYEVEVPKLILVILGGVLMSSTAIIGFKALEKLSFLSVPLLLILVLWPIVQMHFAGTLPEIFSREVDNALSIGTLIGLTAGGWIAGAIVMPDIMRYSRNKKNAVLTVVLGFIVLYPALVIMSAILGIASGETDLIAVMIAMALGIPAMLILVFATWTTNDSNLYTASLSLSAVFQKIAKWKLAIIAGAIGTVLASFGIMQFFIPWLSALGIVIAPIAGVIIADYLNDPEKYAFKNLKKVPAYNHTAIGTWLIGCLVGFATAPSGVKGLELFSFTTIPPLDALLVTFIVKYALEKIRK